MTALGRKTNWEFRGLSTLFDAGRLFRPEPGKAFYRIFINYDDYGIYDSLSGHFLQLAGKISSSIVFNEEDFHRDYAGCENVEDLEYLVAKWTQVHRRRIIEVVK